MSSCHSLQSAAFPSDVFATNVFLSPLFAIESRRRDQLRIRIVRCVYQVLSSTLVFIVARQVLPPLSAFPFTTALIRGHPVFLFSQAGDDDPSSIIDSAARYRFFANDSHRVYSNVPETTQRPLADSSGWLFAQTPPRCHPTLKCRQCSDIHVRSPTTNSRLAAGSSQQRLLGFIANRFFYSISIE